MVNTIIGIAAIAVTVVMIAGLPYIIMKKRRRRARAMAEPTFDHLERLDLDDDDPRGS